ncbi:hypothetical protein [Nocardiopsis sp. HUAS JQ3]|uniref:hypothetical protein n=1 Tax=Nocardiopsis sp. HUAS JQ3 TaxID=3061629 RepID=UPI0023A99690|nr:hypothetical protein [Nocardiopsis sp. HUAS JQ3]WDZ88796.1 hypothetical protein PV789_17690 [Nocardiopsis sp. HUAS JQ3]
MVLAHRPLRASTDTAALSRFGEPVWHLGPGLLDDQLCPVSENWPRLIPGPLREGFMTCAWVALNTNWPAQLQPGLIDEQPEVLTVHKWIMSMSVFARWLDSCGITRLCDVSSQDLSSYKNHVLDLSNSMQDKGRLLHAVRVLWGYRDALPEEHRLPRRRPWGMASTDDLVGAKRAQSPYNTTPRIDPATMEALLAWALRMIEDFGPDIRDAAQEVRLLLDGRHPATLAARERFGHAPLKERFASYLAQLQRANRGLPGTRRRERHGGQLGVDHEHVARMVASSGPCVKPYDGLLLSMAENYGLELESDAYFLGPITATFQGAPWRDRPIGVREVNQLVRHLTAACFVVICYLSGMRSGEVLQLRRGCLREDEHGGLMLVGRRSKGSGHDPAPEPEKTQERPWAVVSAVVPAVEMLESLSDADLLFPPSRQRTTTVRARRNQSKPSGTMNDDIREFVDWVNTQFSGRDDPAIPPDPAKAIHAARFRRTLAYFVVRRPGGLAAAQAQYGHVRAKVTLGYAGDADTRWMESLAVEELEMISEQMDEDLRALAEGEYVSGPSAQEYQRRVRKAGAVFTGRVVNQAGNAQRLLAGKHPHIHHGLGMTCVWRPETAACRQEREAAGLDVRGPDPQLCRTTCTNLAYTDRDIENKRRELTRHETAAADPLSPKPLRDREAAKAAQAHAVIVAHDQGRRGNNRQKPRRERLDGAQTS